MRWTIAVGFAMVMACSDDTSMPGDGAATAETSSDETTDETADATTSNASGSSQGTSETSPAESSESDSSSVECYDDLECPGTEICTQWSPGDSSCVPSGECSSKVECPEGFECQTPSHHTSNGECVPEDPSTSGTSTQGSSSESMDGTESSTG